MGSNCDIRQSRFRGTRRGEWFPAEARRRGEDGAGLTTKDTGNTEVGQRGFFNNDGSEGVKVDRRFRASLSLW